MKKLNIITDTNHHHVYAAMSRLLMITIVLEFADDLANSVMVHRSVINKANGGRHSSNVDKVLDKAPAQTLLDPGDRESNGHKTVDSSVFQFIHMQATTASDLHPCIQLKSANVTNLNLSRKLPNFSTNGLVERVQSRLFFIRVSFLHIIKTHSIELFSQVTHSVKATCEYSFPQNVKQNRTNLFKLQTWETSAAAYQVSRQRFLSSNQK